MADESLPADEASPSEDDGRQPDESITRCDYWRLPCPGDPITTEHDGVTYSFCSDACRAAQEESDRVHTQYHGFRRYQTSVAALDAGLPQGVPRNSFVLLTGLPGTRSEAIMAELVWRALQRGEPVVYVTFLEPPVSVIQKFVTLEWNVLPYLESGRLHILDCFTYRLEDRDRMFERMDEWNHHLAAIAEEATTTVRDPSSTGQLENQLDDCLTAQGMDDEGIVVVDSLTELGSLLQPVQAYNFVKDIRAEVCKGRFIPIFAGATRTGDKIGFPHDLGYMVDGIVELRLNEDIVEDALIKQIRVRKMNGVLTYPEWSAYEYTSGQGIVMFDPLAELEKKGEETVEDDDGSEVADDPPADDRTETTGDDGDPATDATEAGDAETAGEDGAAASENDSTSPGPDGTDSA